METTDTVPVLLEAGGKHASMKKLKSEVTGEPAPRPDGNNLFIQITIGVDKATFDCRLREHVGTQQGRFVTFVADNACVLWFTNPAVFGVDQVQLAANTPTVPPLRVPNSIHNAMTECTVDTVTLMDSTTEAITASSPRMIMGGPQIVVP